MLSQNKKETVMQYECVLIGLNELNWANKIRQDYVGLKLMLHNQSGNHTNPLSALNDPILCHGRYDAALIYVDHMSISIWRAALSAKAKNLPLPLIIYAADLKSQTLKDFLHLGVADFISPPFSHDEFRTRVENAATRKSNNIISENIKIYQSKHNGSNSKPTVAETEKSLCDSILDRSGTELEAYAVALATQKATDKATFKAAKNEIITHFEQAYIKASLNRHCGNVTLAARMAQKHRRAFWALMKKHNIDPNPYRIN